MRKKLVSLLVLWGVIFLFGSFRATECKAQTRTIILDPNGGSIGTTSIEVEDGQVLQGLPIPEGAYLGGHSNERYMFVGWYAEKDPKALEDYYFGGDVVTRSFPSTLYAHYVDLSVFLKEIHIVTLDANGGESSVSRIVAGSFNPSKTIDYPIPTLLGYEFNGWYTKSGIRYDNVYPGTRYIVSNVELKAKWSRIKYNILFQTNGGSSDTAKKEIYYNEKYGTLPVPERLGYTFYGWYSEEGEKYDENDTFLLLADQTLSAHWSENSYLLSFDPFGGLISFHEKTIKMNQPITSLPIAQKENYIFEGWFTAEGIQVTVDTIFQSAKDITLYAHWRVKPDDTKPDEPAAPTAAPTVPTEPTVVPTASTAPTAPTTAKPEVKTPEVTISNDTKVDQTKSEDSKSDVNKPSETQKSKASATVTRIQISNIKKIYYTGQKIDTSKVEMLVFYADGSKKKLTKGWNVQNYKTSIGYRTVVFAYQGATCKVKCLWINKSIITGTKLKKSSYSCYQNDKNKIQLAAKYDLSDITSFQSSNKNILTVSKQGVINAIAPGSAKVTVTVKVGGVKKKLSVTVKVKQPTYKITYSKDDKWNRIDFKAKGSGIKNCLKWYVSDSKIAKINSETGEFTALKQGTVTVKAKAGTIIKSMIVIIDKKSEYILIV